MTRALLCCFHPRCVFVLIVIWTAAVPYSCTQPKPQFVLFLLTKKKTSGELPCVGLMPGSEVILIALKRLSALLAHSSVRLCSSVAASPSSTASAACFTSCILQPHIRPIPSWTAFFFLPLGIWEVPPPLYTRSRVCCAEKARVHKFHILPQPVQFAITCFEAGADLLHGPFFFFSLLTPQTQG